MNKILVPVDFSEVSENAFDYAAEMANSFSANLVLLHVNQIPASSPEFGLSAYNVADTKQASLEALKNLENRVQAKYPLISKVEYFAEIGNPSDLILEFAKDQDIDLVIMGNSGHGSKLKKALIGSTSVSVSRKIETPLIIIPPHVKYKPIENLAYSCDYDEHIAESTTLIKVRNLCTIFNSTLSIIHVIPEDHLINEVEAVIDYYVETKLTTTNHKTFIITENKVSQGLIDFINNHEVDMIIIEPKKHSLIHTLFYPSVTNDLAFASPVPVLAIHG